MVEVSYLLKIDCYGLIASFDHADGGLYTPTGGFPMVDTGNRRLLRVGELSRRTGVSTSAINYYVRLGILPPPAKTAPNMAHYDPGYVDMVNSIKVLQQERGLSLSEIRRLFERGEFKHPDGMTVAEAVEDRRAAGETVKALDRRRHIMEVAAAVFAEKGYYATTISDLARAAGIAKGTIYWYFNNKREIMLAILEGISREILGTFDHILREAPDGLQALLGCVEPALELLEKNGPIYLMYFMEIGSTDPEIQEKYREIYRLVHTGTSYAIRRGMKEGVIRPVDADVAAYSVMGLVERLGRVSGAFDTDTSTAERAGEAREFIRRALRATSGGKAGKTQGR